MIALSLTTLENDVIQTCSAKELHLDLGVGRDFSNWIKSRIADYGFVAGVDFVPDEGFSSEKLDSPNLANQVSAHGGDRRSIDYQLTLDMAKELAMLEKTPKGREVRKYFIACEKDSKLLTEKLANENSALLNLANATTAIYENAYEAMYTEAKNIVRSVHDYKCDVVSNNGYEERQRSIASMGGAKAVSMKRMKELLAVEDSFNARAERVFDATRKKQIKDLEDIAIGVIVAKEG